uniref:Uncharacterized protein n=1 Tax=Oryza nivara TaxID=4536 RepID=A0A0E0FFZ8_ORYNI
MLGAIPPLTAMLDESGCGSCGDVDAAGSSGGEAWGAAAADPEAGDLAAVKLGGRESCGGGSGAGDLPIQPLRRWWAIGLGAPAVVAVLLLPLCSIRLFHAWMQVAQSTEVWCEHNARIFRHKVSTLALILAKIEEEARAWAKVEQLNSKSSEF